MSYVVTSNHSECLADGRMVSPGEVLTNVDTRANQRLIERGALTKRAERRKPKPAPKPPKAPAKAATKPEPKQPPKPEPQKEESK